MIGRKIGEGACAEIFEWNGDPGGGAKVVKVGRSHLDRRALLEEFHHHQAAWSLGLPVPRAFDLVDVDGRTGIVYERVFGESAMERLIQEALAGSRAVSGSGDVSGLEDVSGSGAFVPDLPRAFDDIRRFAHVLSRIHGHTVDHLPLQRDDIKARLPRTEGLSVDEIAAILAILDALPEKRQLCHGDPNPGNVMIRVDDAMVIDWMDASLGSPEADVADFVLMIRFGALPPDLPQEAAAVVNSLREGIIEEFLSEYERLTGIGKEGVDAWIAPMAARRLTMGTRPPEEKDALIAEIRRRLQRGSFGDRIRLVRSDPCGCPEAMGPDRDLA